jgi:hypothetical protein
MTISQAGSNFNVITGATTDFTGNYAVESVQTSINHELMLLAIIGRSFNDFTIYLGIGPALFGMQSNIYHLIGTSYINPTQKAAVQSLSVSINKTF